MTMLDIVKNFAEKQGISQNKARNLVKNLLSEIEDGLKKNEKVSFLGFGSFETVKREAKKMHVPDKDGNPRIIEVKEHYSVKFKPSGKLKEKISKALL